MGGHAAKAFREVPVVCICAVTTEILVRITTMKTLRLLDQMIPDHRQRIASRFVLSSTAMACLAGLCLLARPAVAAVGPRLAYEPDKIDFGVRPRGLHLSGVFTIRNTGDETLKVSGFDTSCGCITSGQDKFDVDPGHAATLTFQLNTQDYTDGAIKLKTNVPGRPKIMLPIHVTIIEDVQVTDDHLSFGLVERGQTPAVSLTVWSTNAHRPVRIRSLTSNLASLELWHKSTIDKASRPGETVYARLKSANLPLGRFGGWVNIVLDPDKKPAIKMEISGNVVAGIVLKPARMRIKVAKRELRQDVRRSVTLTHSNGKEFRIRRAVSSDPNVSVDFDDRLAAPEHRVTLRLSRATGKTEWMSATVRLFTDNRKAPYSVKAYYTVW